jgi:linoleoyl-CoA desaturase
MKTEKLQVVRFAPKGRESFYDAVTADVNTYFETNNVSPYANKEMWIKTIVMLLIYFIPYVFIVAGLARDSLWLFWGLWFLMGCGMAGMGTSIMHDANHGAYSARKKTNNFISHIIEIIGGYTVTWRIQHNILHHTYTNIGGLDEDIEAGMLLRFSPHSKKLAIHRYQHIYAWILYGLLTLQWATIKDYKLLLHYHQNELLKKQRISMRKALLQLTGIRIFYFSYLLVIPLLFSGMPWYVVLAGFFIMHFIAGFFLSCIFQPSHIMETSTFSSPVATESVKRMKDSWAVHELANTTDFAPHNRLLCWFSGGLNYQIEHHLFTGICHVHYPKIASIVKAKAEEFGLPYHVQPTFLRALSEHARMLKKLGRMDGPGC